jgi:hypothetical protein
MAPNAGWNGTRSYEMAREWTSNDLGGASREFLCASARVAPEFGLLCAQVACVVFFGPGVFTPESTLSQAGDEWRNS